MTGTSDSASTDIESGSTTNLSPTSEQQQKHNEKEKKGVHLTWKGIVKTVTVRDESRSGLVRSSLTKKASSSSLMTAGGDNDDGATKCILDDVSGSAKPGEIVALMGPSGSGKTSLLDVLSGRSTYTSGTLFINQAPATPAQLKKLKRKIAYVKQQDIFFEHLTVRDQLTYTAFLRLPSSWTSNQKVDEVNRLISLLNLDKCADSGLRFVSGGEKKRVNIGSELLSDPDVIMLDEPTSGLDSTNAVSLIKVLRSMGREDGMTILTSIHQPSSAVFRSFDRLVMLAEGKVVYFGTPEESLWYLKEEGYECPSGYNAADHWMDLLVVGDAAHGGNVIGGEDDDEQEDTEKNENKPLKDRDLGPRTASVITRSVMRGSTKFAPREVLIRAWDDDKVQQAFNSFDEDITTKDTTESDVFNQEFDCNTSPARKYNASWLTQFTILTHRSLKNSKSAIFTPLNMLKSAMIGLVTGLLWFRMENTEKTVNDRVSYFFFTMTYWVFDAMFNALMSFPLERAVIFKERASGSYHLSAYFMAKTISEAPTRLALPCFYCVISYWMTNANPKFSIFLATTGCTLMSVMAGESLGLLVGTSVMDFEKAMTVVVIVSLSLMLTGGFFVENMPSFIKWVKFLSPFKYSFDASQQMVFDRDVPCDGSGVFDQCAGGDEGVVTPEEVRNFLGAQGSVGFNVFMLFLIIVIPRYFAYLFLRSKKGTDR